MALDHVLIHPAFDLAPLALAGMRIDALDAQRDVLPRGQPGHQAGGLEHHRLVRPGDIDLAEIDTQPYNYATNQTPSSKLKESGLSPAEAAGATAKA